MRSAVVTDNDIRTRNAVVLQLEADPQVDASEIGVGARNGVVTLTGHVDSYRATLAAERAAKRVPGVRAIANNIIIRLVTDRTDSELATDTARALDLRITVPQTVQAIVHNGYVTLTGKVDWLFQKRDAEAVARDVSGVRGVMNHIQVVSRRTQRDTRDRIVHALRRDVPSTPDTSASP
jgi:osmotically-inducible protein OsmY